MSRILLVGATGYVGGTVLSQLLESTVPSLRNLVISVLIRKEEQGQKLREEYGERVQPILWTGLSDTAFIEDTAAQYDIVINSGSGFVPEGAKAFATGLARRVGTDNPVPWLIHTAGCTNLVNTGREFLKEWNDETDGEAIYDYLEELEQESPWPQRTAELAVLQTSETNGVQAVSLQAPVIFGKGSGLFNQRGLLVPMVVGYVVRHGHGFKLNDTASYDWVHVQDLANYYVLIVRTILEHPDRGVGYIPTGKRGVLFPNVGRVLVSEMNQKALDTCFAAGVLPREDTPQQKEIQTKSLKEIADELGAGLMELSEKGWVNKKEAKGILGQKLLGWAPTRLESAWDRDFQDEVEAFDLGQKGQLNLENCMATEYF